MSRLESLPTEIFQQITSYLHYFDQQSLSSTSRKCHILTSQFTCNNTLFWQISRYTALISLFGRGGPKQRAVVRKERLIDESYTILDQLDRLSEHMSHSYPLVPDHEGRIPKLIDSNNTPANAGKYVGALLEPYFALAFPMSSLAYFYMAQLLRIAEIVNKALGLGDGDWRAITYDETFHKEVLSLKEKRNGWAVVESTTSRRLAWLKRRVPLKEFIVVGFGAASNSP